MTLIILNAFINHVYFFKLQYLQYMLQHRKVPRNYDFTYMLQ